MGVDDHHHKQPTLIQQKPLQLHTIYTLGSTPVPRWHEQIITQILHDVKGVRKLSPRNRHPIIRNFSIFEISTENHYIQFN
jgi:hypothetical protein